MNLQLVVDEFFDGRYHSTRAADSIGHEMDCNILGGWEPHQTLRTRYYHDSRFHVYYVAESDHTIGRTQIFRFERTDDQLPLTMPARCIECNQLIPDEGDGFERIRCVDCAMRDAPIPQESDPNPFVRGIALFALLICFLSLTSQHASARDYRDIDTRHYDPSIILVTQIQAAKYPPPDGCAVVGGWDDGSIVAYCVNGTWLTHGPEAHDEYAPYDGPLMARWLDRAELVTE